MSDPDLATDSIQARRDRPQFTPGYGVDRSATEHMLDWETIEVDLERARNYWIATTREDGRPHTAPVWGLWMDHAFYFSSDPSSTKGRNLAARAEAVVHLESGDDVAILEGRVERVHDSATLDRFCDVYDAKYQFRPDTTDPAFGVYCFHPGVAFAWHEKNFPDTATRWTFESPS